MSDVFTEIGWQDIRLIVGEGNLSPTEVLAACNAIMRERIQAALAASPAPQSGEPVMANYRNAWTALRMIREAVEEFGPLASLESPDAVLLRGPEPIHEAGAIIEALGRVRAAPPPSDVGEIVKWLRARVEHHIAESKLRASIHEPELASHHEALASAAQIFADQIEAGDYRPAKEKLDEPDWHRRLVSEGHLSARKEKPDEV